MSKELNKRMESLRKRLDFTNEILWTIENFKEAEDALITNNEIKDFTDLFKDILKLDNKTLIYEVGDRILRQAKEDNITYDPKFMIEMLDLLTANASDKDCYQLINCLQYLSEYDDNTVQEIHKRVSKNKFLYFTYVDAKDAYHALTEADDIINLLDYNKSSNYDFEKGISMLSDSILRGDKNKSVETLAEVLNTYINDINDKNTPDRIYDLLKKYLLDDLTSDNEILKYIKENEKIIVKNNILDKELFSIFLRDDAIDINLHRLINYFTLPEQIEFLSNIDPEKISSKKVDIFLSQISYYHEQHLSMEQVNQLSDILVKFDKDTSCFNLIEEDLMKFMNEKIDLAKNFMNF